MTMFQKKSVLFLIIGALVWSLVPLLRHSLPLDTQEALVWGKYCLWGTTKHPPLSGWLAWGFYTLFGRTDMALYLLSQICVLIGLCGIYRLACQFLKPMTALLATFFQLGIIFYHFSTVEFNVNVVSLALWPWTAFFFWRAYRQDKMSDWLMFGVLMAANILNKYVGSVLGIALLVFVMGCPSARRICLNPKAWLGGSVCILCLVPHLMWLYDTQFEMLNYISSRNGSGKMKSVFRHLFYPAKFLLAQVLFALPAGITYWLFVRRLPKRKSENKRDEQLFLLCLGIVPTLFWVISSLVSGTPLKDMWNFPSLFSWGIIAFYLIPHTWDTRSAERFTGVMFCWSLLFAAGYGVQCLVTTSERFHSDCSSVTQQLVTAYQTKTQKIPAYVGGNIWFSDMVTLYAASEIKPMIWMKPASNTWLNQADFEEKGSLVVAENIGEYEGYQKQYPQAVSAPEKVNITYTNYFGRKKVKSLYWGVYTRENNEK